MIGHGSTEFAGKTAQDLRRALVAGETTALAGRGLRGFDVLSHYIPRYLLRRLGWAAWNAHPQAPLRYVRLEKFMAENL